MTSSAVASPQHAGRDSHRGHTEAEHRDLLLAFIDRGRLQDRLEEAVAKAAWKAAGRSYSREELVLRLDWGRLHEVFVAAIEDEARRGGWRFHDRYADAARGVEEIHLPVTDSHRNRVCAADGELFACRTLREAYAAQEMAWGGWDDDGYPSWRGFTDEEAAASRQCYQQTGLHWRPGIGLDQGNGPTSTAQDPGGAGQLAAVGQRVRLLRAAAGLTPSEVADASGIPAGQLYALEAGDWNIDLRSVFRLAAALGAPTAALVPNDTGPPEPEEPGDAEGTARRAEPNR